MKQSKADKAHDLEFSKCYMAREFPKGSTFKGYVVSMDRRSGTRRVVIFGAVMRNGLPVPEEVTAHAARLCGYRLNRDGEIIVPGGGLSATFELISGMAFRVFGSDKAYLED